MLVMGPLDAFSWTTLLTFMRATTLLAFWALALPRTRLKVEDYYDDVEISGSRLKIGFHGDEKTPEQIFIIPFRVG
jgi:hypothetical protein